MDKQKMILLAGAVGLAYFAMAKKEGTGADVCPDGYFLVDGDAICADYLNAMGYVYFFDVDMPTGWYKIEGNFITLGIDEQVLTDLAVDASHNMLNNDAGSNAYVSAQNFLNTFLLPTAVKLQSA